MVCLCVFGGGWGHFAGIWCHFSGPSALTWNRALPLPKSYQFPEEIPAAGKHDPSTLRPSTLGSLCPGACLGLNPRISSDTSLNAHLQASPLHAALHLCLAEDFRQPLGPCANHLRCCSSCTSEETLYPSTPSPSIPSSLCLKFNLIYISPGVTKYPSYQLRCLELCFALSKG